MRASDAFTWYQESDPAMRATIVTVAWLDRAPDWARLVDRVEGATRLVPRLRQRVAELLVPLTVPRWVTDDHFDLSWHLRRTTGRTDDAVLRLAAIEAMTDFDRARPLWVFTLVEDLPDGRAAMLMKLHHALADGIGAVRLAPTLFDTDPLPDFTPHPDKPTRTGGGLVAAGLAHTAGQLLGLAGQAVRAAGPAALGLLRDPVGSLRSAVDTAGSVARTVAPVTDIRSPVMRGRGLGRRLDVVSVPLLDLKRATTAAGVTVNDGFLAAVTGGMRHYHHKHDAPVDELRVTMPISIRTAADPLASNRITLMRFLVPVSEPDPERRMRLISARARDVRHARSLPFTDAIAAGLDLLPTAFVGGMLKRVDFLASDVTGAPVTLYLAGAKVTAHAAFGPTMGCAANLTLLSYDGTCHIATNLDTAAVPDTEVFVDCLRTGVEEVLATCPRRQ
ncbi:diacylglycerol O-acyltransferase [Actinophytocola oryzae]|uniref:diacylglycerol O-acyltransferase n=2 Tax=Actinophytocola oryzae TaxID=502181 RepID=A0A4R7V855_9PSEU|nr:diacylglycerol O-acyltransferase [Actinophytocola oryzae]